MQTVIKKAPESVIGSFFLYSCGVLEFLDRFLSGVGGKQERAVCVIYLDVSVYIFQRAVHVARLPSFSMVLLYYHISRLARKIYNYFVKCIFIHFVHFRSSSVRGASHHYSHYIK